MSFNAFPDMPSKLRGIIFDCDGVIINSRDANLLYYNKILAALELAPLTKDQENFVHMATVRQALAYIVPENLHPKLADVSKTAVNYYRDILPQITLENGFLDFIKWLKDSNILLAVHTNRFDGMPSIIDKFNLHGYFDPIVTAADVTPKPSPEGIFKISKTWNVGLDSLLFVGDSQNDQQSALAGKVAFVAYGDEKLEATINTNSFYELKNILQKRYV